MKNIIGMRFGRLVVTEPLGSKAWPFSKVLCKCDCGKTIAVESRRLKKLNVRSCGCLRIESQKRPKKHGQSRSGTYSVWSGIKTRCYNKNDHSFPNYGGRGITTCIAIRNSVQAIINTIGHKPYGKTIDRINNSEGYHCGICSDCISKKRPMNIRWATLLEQGKNKRTNRIVIINGISRIESEWARMFGLKQVTLSARLRRGWTGEAILQPVKTNHETYRDIL